MLPQHPDPRRERLREALGLRPLPPPAPPPPAPRPAPGWGEVVDARLRGVGRARPSGDLDDIHHHLPGFWQDTADGRAFIVEQRYELEYRHGGLRLGAMLDTSAELWARFGRDRRLAEVDPRRMVFLDTETTGLAGGTGTVAFLVGIGHFLDGHFRLRQYFLRGPSEERALLRALTEYLDGFEAIVTFNGKTFDLPLLETRLILARREQALTALPHLDLLHAARRIYRDRFASCRLGELERQVLGLERQEDVPGAEIPALYFRYLHTRRFRPLVGVLRHNRDDVLSLVTLTAHLARLHGGALPLSAADQLALGREHEHDGRPQEAISCYQAALLLDPRDAERHQCEERLSGLYRKLRRWEEAVLLWQSIATSPANRLLYPLVELSKYYERVAKDLPAAREAAAQALALLESYHARRGYPRAAAERTALTARIARLEARAATGESRRRAATKEPRTISA